MTTKLTLSMDEAVVREAKRIAKENNTSVSAMFTRLVKSMAAGRSQPVEIGPLTRKATGLLKGVPPDRDYKELLTEALMARYGISK